MNDMAAVNIDSQLVSNTRLLQREAKIATGALHVAPLPIASSAAEEEAGDEETRGERQGR